MQRRDPQERLGCSDWFHVDTFRIHEHGANLELESVQLDGVAYLLPNSKLQNGPRGQLGRRLIRNIRAVPLAFPL